MGARKLNNGLKNRQYKIGLLCGMILLQVALSACVGTKRKDPPAPFVNKQGSIYRGDTRPQTPTVITDGRSMRVEQNQARGRVQDAGYYGGYQGDAYGTAGTPVHGQVDAETLSRMPSSESYVWQGQRTGQQGPIVDQAQYQYYPPSNSNNSQYETVAYNAPSVKVGILLPLSGQHKDLGNSMLQAAQLALFDANYSQFELVPRDTGGTSAGAKKAATQAIDGGAELLLGPIFSHEVKAAGTVAQAKNVPLLGFSTDWRVAGGSNFVMGVLPFAQARRMANFAAHKNWRRIGILAPTGTYGDAVVSTFKSSARSLGLSIVKEVRFADGAENVTAEVRSFAEYDKASSQDAAPYDAIFVPVGGNQAKSIFNLLAYYNLSTDRVAYMGTGLWDDGGLHREKAAQKAYYAAPSPALRHNFENKYERTYGSEPPRLVSIAYDATALATVLAKQGVARSGKADFTRQSIVNPNGFAGIDGIFRFHQDGRVERGLAVHQIQHENSRVVSAAPTQFQAGRY